MTEVSAAQRLMALREELTERLARVRTHVGHREEAVERDFAEQAVQRENDEVVEQLGVRLDGELAAIDAALARLEAGTYAQCAQCGEPIGAARQAALPMTAVCVACAART
jgi:DnaK suppressor protein